MNGFVVVAALAMVTCSQSVCQMLCLYLVLVQVVVIGHMYNVTGHQTQITSKCPQVTNYIVLVTDYVFQVNVTLCMSQIILCRSQININWSHIRFFVYLCIDNMSQVTIHMSYCQHCHSPPTPPPSSLPDLTYKPNPKLPT